MIVACDPGIHGAFCILAGASTRISDMPLTQRRVGRTMRDLIDAGELWRFLSLWKAEEGFPRQTLIIEQVGGVPGQSAHASFVFGKGVGEVEMAARAAGFAIERVTSAVWKAALRVPREKEAARIRASELMPEHAHLWPLKKHDGRAEAALIALYAERVLGLT